MGSRCGLWSNLTGGTGSYQQMRRIIWQTVTKIFYGLKHDDPAGRYGLHVLGWLAYRRPPEGEEERHGD